MSRYDGLLRSYKYSRDPFLGLQLGHAWVKWDPAEDCFVFSLVSNTCTTIPDPEPGRPTNTHTIKAPKSLWTQEPYAKVYQTHTEIFKHVPEKYLYPFTGITRRKSSSIKTSGNEWDTGHTQGPVVSDYPVKILNSGKIIPTAPKVRTFDKAKLAEMNAMIKKIRKSLVVRCRLGAFGNFDRAAIERAIPESRWGFYNNASKFLELMNAVDESNIESYYPLLWLASRYWQAPPSGDGWIPRFDGLVNRMREKMRKELGVVSYVDPNAPDEPGADNPDDSVEADKPA